MKMSNKVYDILKYIAQIVLPAIGALYFALAKIWGFPFGSEVNETIVAAATLVAATLEVSSANYYKGAHLHDA